MCAGRATVRRSALTSERLVTPYLKGASDALVDADSPRVPPTAPAAHAFSRFALPLRRNLLHIRIAISGILISGIAISGIV